MAGEWAQSQVCNTKRERHSLPTLLKYWDLILLSTLLLVCLFILLQVLFSVHHLQSVAQAMMAAASSGNMDLLDWMMKAFNVTLTDNSRVWCICCINVMQQCVILWMCCKQHTVESVPYTCCAARHCTYWAGSCKCPPHMHVPVPVESGILFHQYKDYVGLLVLNWCKVSTAHSGMVIAYGLCPVSCAISVMPRLAVIVC